MLQTPTVLNNTQPTGYVSSWDNTFDAATFNWNGQGVLVGTDAAGFEIRYVVHRMCSLANSGFNAPNQQCLTLNVAGGSSGRGSGTYGQTNLAGTTFVYYRITARALGPRNTVSYTQTILY